MDGRDIRRSQTLSDHASVSEDLHKVRDDIDIKAPRAGRSLTIGSSEKREAFSSRAAPGSGSSRALLGVGDFKDRLRLRPDGGEAPNVLPTSPVFGRSMSNRACLPRSASGRKTIVTDYSPEEEEEEVVGEKEEEEAEEEEEEEEEEEAPAEEQPVTMSLMALLGGMSEDEDEDEDDEEEEVEVVADESSEMYHVCCVCMVRHKGAAFVPCGHTFCRLCSRELWVSRGNCPLCNGYILEILDIF